SLFKTFEENSELVFSFSDYIMKKHNITEDERKRIISILKVNIREKYYLTCFSLESPLKNNDMWKNFADNCKGYCLEYETNDIVRAIKHQALGKARIKIVKYESEPYKIDDIIDLICSKTGIRKELENNLIDEAIQKSTPLIGEKIVNLYFHKKLKYQNEKEIRLVLQNVRLNSKPNEPYNHTMLYVKPKKIYISSDLNIIDRHILIEYANKNGIESKVLELRR
ncbi:MAG: DUF2971 domain-containing protein, partial [Bacilli bacterium]|nr:DUF2971 domain-containing protein [Bacilli bacterium]